MLVIVCLMELTGAPTATELTADTSESWTMTSAPSTQQPGTMPYFASLVCLILQINFNQTTLCQLTHINLLVVNFSLKG